MPLAVIGREGPNRTSRTRSLGRSSATAGQSRSCFPTPIFRAALAGPVARQGWLDCVSGQSARIAARWGPITCDEGGRSGLDGGSDGAATAPRRRLRYLRSLTTLNRRWWKNLRAAPSSQTDPNRWTIARTFTARDLYRLRELSTQASIISTGLHHISPPRPFTARS